MAYVQIQGDKVVNVVEADAKTAKSLNLREHPSAQIGWRVVGDDLLPPLPDADKLWAELRAERDRRLKEEVDGMNAVRWASMNTAERKAWQEYRQALLDLPQNTTDPARAVWPEKPPRKIEAPAKTTRRRARTKSGTFKGDDPLTPDTNEAWVES